MFFFALFQKCGQVLSLHFFRSLMMFLYALFQKSLVAFVRNGTTYIYINDKIKMSTADDQQKMVVLKAISSASAAKDQLLPRPKAAADTHSTGMNLAPITVQPLSKAKPKPNVTIDTHNTGITPTPFTVHPIRKAGSGTYNTGKKKTPLTVHPISISDSGTYNTGTTPIPHIVNKRPVDAHSTRMNPTPLTMQPVSRVMPYVNVMREPVEYVYNQECRACPVSECKRQMFTNFKFKDHFMSCHVPVSAYYVCTSCDFTNKSLKKVVQHCAVYHGIDEHEAKEILQANQKYACNVDYIYPGKYRLIGIEYLSNLSPEEVMHVPPAMSYCPVAACMNIPLSNSLEHWQLYHMPTMLRYKCSQCHINYKEKEVLQKHLKTDHNYEMRHANQVAVWNTSYISPDPYRLSVVPGAQMCTQSSTPMNVSQPSTGVQSVLSGVQISQPSTSVQSAPSGVQISQPSTDVQSVTSQVQNSQPTTSVQSAPSEVQISQPSTDVQSVPFGVQISQPSTSIQSVPSGVQISQPSSSVQSVADSTAPLRTSVKTESGFKNAITCVRLKKSQTANTMTAKQGTSSCIPMCVKLKTKVYTPAAKEVNMVRKEVTVKDVKQGVTIQTAAIRNKKGETSIKRSRLDTTGHEPPVKKVKPEVSSKVPEPREHDPPTQTAKQRNNGPTTKVVKPNAVHEIPRPRKHENLEAVSQEEEKVWSKNNVHILPADTVICPVPKCHKKQFVDRSQFRRHFKWYHIPISRYYCCVRDTFCDFVNKGFNKTVLHCTEKHGPDNKFKIEQLMISSSRVAPNIDFIDPGPIHINGMTDLYESSPDIIIYVSLPWQRCPVLECNQYRMMQSLKEHWVMYHSPVVQAYNCCVCSQIFIGDPNLLKSHLQLEHSYNHPGLIASALDDHITKVCSVWNKSYIDPGPFRYRDPSESRSERSMRKMVTSVENTTNEAVIDKSNASTHVHGVQWEGLHTEKSDGSDMTTDLSRKIQTIDNSTPVANTLHNTVLMANIAQKHKQSVIALATSKTSEPSFGNVKPAPLVQQSVTWSKANREYLPPQTVKCPVPVCKEKHFSSTVNFRQHFASFHIPIRAYFICPECDYVDIGFKKSVRHCMLYHMYNEDYAVQVMLKGSQRHVHNTEFIDPGPYHISGYKDLYDSAPDKIIYVSRQDRLCPVSQCKRYKLKTTLLNHWNTFHLPVLVHYECFEYCGASYRSKMALSIHMLNQHGYKQSTGFTGAQIISIRNTKYIDPGCFRVVKNSGQGNSSKTVTALGTMTSSKRQAHTVVRRQGENGVKRLTMCRLKQYK